MLNRNFDGVLPAPGELDEVSRALLGEARRRFAEVESYIEAVRLRQALQSSMALAQAANRYLDQKEPWRAVRRDKDDAAQTLWTALTAINCLKTTMYPSCHSARRNCTRCSVSKAMSKMAAGRGDDTELRPGLKIQRPTPLFQKLDEEVIAAEEQRIGD